MTKRTDKLMKLREEKDALEDEYWTAWAKAKSGLDEDSDQYFTGAINRLNDRIARVENDLDETDLVDLEIAEDGLHEQQKQKERLFDRYNTDQPANIADYWA